MGLHRLQCAVMVWCFLEGMEVVSVQIMWLDVSLQQIRPFSMHKPDSGSTCWQKARQDVRATAYRCCSSAEPVVVGYGDLLGDLWESRK